jgi:hypothetical protein
MNVSIKNAGIGTFGITTIPPGSLFPKGTTFQWTTSSVLIGTVVPGPTGLTCTVTGVSIGETTLTFAATMPNNVIVQNSIPVQVTA